MSRGVLACRTFSCSPSVRDAASSSLDVISAKGLVGLTSRAMMVAVGINSCSSCSRFDATSTPNSVTPVTLPPGRLEASDEAIFDRVARYREDNGNVRLGRRHYRLHSRGIRKDHSHLTTNQLSRHRRQSIILALSPAEFDHCVATLDITSFAQTLAECSYHARIRGGRRATEKPDHRHRRLLRTRSEWPCRRCTAEKYDEIAPSHCLPRKTFKSVFFYRPEDYTRPRIQ